MSYFVGGKVNEDKGFALKPWQEISLIEMDYIERNELKVVMGALKFKPHELDEVTVVAFTFLLVNVDDSLKNKGSSFIARYMNYYLV